MKCFYFSSETKKGNQTSTKPPSGQSNGTPSTEQDISGSGFNSQSTTSDMSANSSGTSAFPSFSQKPNTLRVFTYLELKNATRNFSRSLMIGEGGFGCVYRGTLRGPEDPHTKIEIAVKQLSQRGLQGHKEWLTEVDVLGVVDHPNLVKLLGYCAEDDERGMQRLLVYEFMPNRSVEDHLSARSAAPLSWSMRLRVALDAARGLTYLHEGMEFQVVGTIGYAAPEYIQTGHLTAKSDIWSYGIVLYELITGRRPLDRNRPKSEQKLLDWIRPYISDINKFCMILDPRLEGNYSLKSAQKLAAVANRCLMRRPRARPKMSEVLEMVNRIVESEETGTPELPLISDSQHEAALEEEKKGRASSERMIADLRMGGGRRLVWRGWTPKLVRVPMVPA